MRNEGIRTSRKMPEIRAREISDALRDTEESPIYLKERRMSSREELALKLPKVNMDTIWRDIRAAIIDLRQIQ